MLLLKGMRNTLKRLIKNSMILTNVSLMLTKDSPMLI